MVTKDRNGADGAVELLEDERIRSEELTKPEQTVGGDPCTSFAGRQMPPFCKGVKTPLQPARVRLVASDGRELSTLTMQRPLVGLELVYLRAGVPSFQVTVDLMAELGSYSGLATRFAEVRSGTLTWLGAVDVRTGKAVEVAVASTLKTEWKLSPTSGGKEVLQIACRPDFDASESDAGMKFLTTFSRFAFEGDRWQRHTRVRKGCWENDNVFPARAQFP